MSFLEQLKENENFMNIMILLIVMVFMVAAVFFIRRCRRKKPQIYDTLEGHEFEYYCADLLENKGFIEVEVTKGSGDYGADILAEKDGVTYYFTFT